jgi:hypothetical protein
MYVYVEINISFFSNVLFSVLFVCRYKAVISHFLKTAQNKNIPFYSRNTTANGKKLKHFFLVACFSQINYAVSFFSVKHMKMARRGQKATEKEINLIQWKILIANMPLICLYPIAALSRRCMLK